MAVPRVKCLNASGHAMKKTLGSRAPFSTSQIRAADERPRTSSADILAALGGEPSQRSGRVPPSSFRLPTGPSRIKTPAPGNLNATTDVQRLIAEADQRRITRTKTRRLGELSKGSADQLAHSQMGDSLSKQISRRWKAGDVYAPHDLSEVEMAKWKKRGRPVYDAFDVLDFKPQDHYQNFSIMSEYMTPMGRIMHSNETGLRPVNQRRIARAIRRSIGIGMMPSVYRHPELLQLRERREQQRSPTTRGPDM